MASNRNPLERLLRKIRGISAHDAKTLATILSATPSIPVQQGSQTQFGNYISSVPPSGNNVITNLYADAQGKVYAEYEDTGGNPNAVIESNPPTGFHKIVNGFVLPDGKVQFQFEDTPV